MEPFGRLTLFDTATFQELLDCSHSKAHEFNEEWEGEMMQTVKQGGRTQKGRGKKFYSCNSVGQIAMPVHCFQVHQAGYLSPS